jgi:hypothetical protein
MDSHPSPSGVSVSDKYQAALADHKHYDNASLAVASGVVLIPGAVIQVAFGKPVAFLLAIVVIGCVITVSLFLLYSRLAAFSSIARQIAAAIEEDAFSFHGPSCAFRDSRIQPQRGFIYRIVRSLTAVSLFCMAAFGAYQWLA